MGRRAIVAACGALLLWGTACGGGTDDATKVASVDATEPVEKVTTTTELPTTARPRPTTTTTTTTTTTAPPTTTTTTTTAPPTTTTTTAPPPPPPTAPPTTASPPPPAGGGCTPGYDPCVPVASDVDCAGGSGDGPAYVDGPISVSGSDPYDLDRDGDGVACES